MTKQEAEASEHKPVGEPKRVFLVFEGGGAKGVVHVGALRALEGHGVKIAGAAGTSAGAIVAALVAAGYSSNELIDEHGRSPLLRSLGLECATDFFGSTWSRLARLRWACSDLPVAALFVAFPCMFLAWLANILFSLGLAWTCWVFAVAVAALLVLIARRLSRGVTQLDILVDKLEIALARKLHLKKGARVLFKDLQANGLPLRVVATDIAARRLELFSYATTPDVRVAEAVAASAALPIACAPLRIGSQQFVDGGIVSNLPAWTFDEERALDPDAVTVAISIEAGLSAAGTSKMGTLRFLVSIFLSAMFGRRHLETRAAPRLLTLSVPTDIQTVDFDIGPCKAREAVENAHAFAKIRIGEQLFVWPQEFEGACNEVGKLFDQRVNSSSQPRWRTRVLVALRDEGARSSWRIQFGSNLLSTDADDQILLPDDSTIVGHAALARIPILDVPPFGPEVALNGAVNRYRRALVRKDLEWCLAIPIFKHDAQLSDEPIAVLAVDSDLGVGHFNFTDQVIADLADDARALVLPVVTEYQSLDL